MTPIEWTQTAAAAAAVVAAGYALTCLLVAWRFTTARRSGGQSLPSHYLGQRFVSRDGTTPIDAWYRPTVDARAAVVLVHGKDACRGDVLRAPCDTLVEAFVRAGIAVLMIDLRGHGASGKGRITYGDQERQDVLGAVDWLRAQGHSQIGLLGASLGAATSLFAAADDPLIGAVVADSPFADFGQMIERQYRKQSHLPSCFLPGALAISRWVTGIDYRRIRPIEAARRLAGRPLLVIHSQHDHFIPACDSEAIASSASGSLWITNTRGHIGSYRSDPAGYSARVVAFMSGHLQAA